MFPTTIWTVIRRAGENDGEALEKLASSYRDSVRGFLQGRGSASVDAEDLCREVLVRLLQGQLLARPDGKQGRFLSLLRAVVTHAVQDHRRRRRGARAGPAVPPDAFFEFEEGMAYNAPFFLPAREEGSGGDPWT